MYIPLEIKVREFAGLYPSLEAMRLPKRSIGDTSWGSRMIGPEDIKLAKKLILAGDDHGKFNRGIEVWLRMECQAGWLIQFLTYRWGVEPLSSSSTMHGNLRQLSVIELAEKKQFDLPDLTYTRIEKVSYQALRRMYRARRNHRHPDWGVFCNFIETLPHFDIFIMPEKRS